MKTAIYPGTFDPITNGHIDIIKRSAVLFDELIVVVLTNRSKQPLFSLQERLCLAKESLSHIANVRVAAYDGLTLDYARQVNACAMIRGIRGVLDYEYELLQASCNKHIDKQIETLFLLSDPAYAFVSSTSVKEFAAYHQSLDGLVSECVKQALLDKF